MDGDAVGVGPGLELVGQLHPLAELFPGVGVVAGADVGALVDQHLGREREQVGLLLAGLLPPGVEVAGGDHVGRHPLVVEVVERLVVDHDVAAAGPVFQLLDLAEQPAVVLEELVVGVPVAFDQRVPDEQLTRQVGVDAAVVDLAPDHERHAVEGDLLQGDHGALVLLPVGLGVAAFDQVLRQRLDPVWLDLGVDPGPEARGLDQLGRHEPLRLFLGQRGAGEDGEAGVAGAEVLLDRPAAVLAALLVDDVLDADVRQQPDEQGHVHLVRRRRLAVGLGPERLAYLAVDVLPLAYTQVVEELGLAQPPERAGRQLLLLVAQVVPQVEVGHEVGLGVGEAAVLLVGLLLLVGGPLAWVLDGQRGGDHHDLAQAAVLLGFEHHAAQARVDRQLGQLAADAGEVAVGVERAQLVQQVDAVLHLAAVRRLDERERLDVAEPDRGHLEDDGGQVGA